MLRRPAPEADSQRALQHSEVWKHCQGSGKAHTEVLQHLMVCRQGVKLPDDALRASLQRFHLVSPPPPRLPASLTHQSPQVIQSFVQAVDMLLAGCACHWTSCSWFFSCCFSMNHNQDTQGMPSFKPHQAQGTSAEAWICMQIQCHSSFDYLAALWTLRTLIPCLQVCCSLAYGKCNPTSLLPPAPPMLPHVTMFQTMEHAVCFAAEGGILGFEVFDDACIGRRHGILSFLSFRCCMMLHIQSSCVAEVDMQQWQLHLWAPAGT